MASVDDTEARNNDSDNRDQLDMIHLIYKLNRVHLANSRHSTPGYSRRSRVRPVHIDPAVIKVN
jgi:hypothetical protein